LDIEIPMLMGRETYRMTQKNIRSVDHLVLPVSDIDVSRARFSALGFTVAANGIHPFGTVNACVFLPDKTYLEPLAIGDANVAKAAITGGNVFVACDQIFRQKRDEGLSAIVLQSDDAQSDQEAFIAASVSGGDMLEFSRPVVLPDGQHAISRFHLAFAVDPAEDAFFLFSCQRLDPLPADRTALETHANGVTGIKRVLLQSGSSERSTTWLTSVLGVAGYKITNGLAFDAANLSIEVGASNDAGDSLTAYALVFSVADLEVTAAVLTANGVDHVKTQDGIVVPAAPGQGVAFLFEENAP
jgi:catechol 2,3-dioxygenase-like lactoylglutathione lyase family enzyme